jgi:serine/threonine-protein kinase HipA
MKEDNVLQVYYEEKRVGILALTADHKAAFQYDEKWLENGFFDFWHCGDLNGLGMA